MNAVSGAAAPSPLAALLELVRSLLSLLLWLLAGAAALAARCCGGAWALVPAQRRRPLALAAGALLLAAALYGALLFPQRAALDSWRRLRQYWGVGWCEPYAPPRVDYAFAPTQGPGLTWAGDADFWREFPCARESYRVVLPDGEAPRFSSAAAAAAAAAASASSPASAAAAAGAGAGVSGGGGDGGGGAAPPPPAPPPPDDCGSTIVTGLFDIGREHWASYSRKKSAYLHDARVVLGLPNRMVIFTSPDLVDHFVAERRRRGLMDRTVVFGMSVYCIPYAWLLEPVTRIMCSADFSRGAAYLEIPERQQPFYK
jgi:hypothetical protein